MAFLQCHIFIGFVVLFDTSWTQDVNWMCIRRSKDVLDIFWTFYIGSIYVLCPGGNLLARILYSQYLLVQIQQWKHQNNKWNLFKVTNVTNLANANLVVLGSLSFTSTDFTHCSTVSMVDFEQINAWLWACLVFM